jgi:hypothetical protein
MADTPTPQGSDTPALPEPFGYVMEWPAPGGGTESIFSRTDAAGRAIGCLIREVFSDFQVRALMAERDAAREERDALRREVEARKPLTDDDWQAIADDCDRIIPAVIKQAVMRRLAPPSADGGDRG